MQSSEVKVDAAFLERGRGPGGGWNRKQLAILGIAWPPFEGWRRFALLKTISSADAERFLAAPKSGKNRPKKAKKQRRQKVVSREDFLAELPRLRDLATDHGITIRVGEIKSGSGHVRSHHVMFEAGEVRVLNWWPATGTTWAPTISTKGKALDCYAALDEAARIAAEELTPSALPAAHVTAPR